MDWQEGILTVPVLPTDPPSPERCLDMADLSHFGSNLVFVFSDGCRPYHSQKNMSSSIHFASSSHHHHDPFRINHWVRLIMVISHSRRTKISISCNPAHVILNPVLPHKSSTFGF